MRQMRCIIRECFRYRISGIAMVSCFVVSMLALHYGVQIFSNIIKEQNEKNNYMYSNQLNMTGSVVSMEDMPQLPDSVKCNMKICGVMVHDDMDDVTRFIDIIVSSYMEKWPLVEGRYATDTMIENKEKIALIGQDLVQYARIAGDGMYYSIAGDEYKVIGVLGSEKSAIFDESILLYAGCLGANIEKYVVNPSIVLNIALESDVDDVDDVYDKYINGRYDVVRSGTQDVADQYLTSVEPLYNEKQYCVYIYLFSLACIWLIVRFWLTQRLHEIKICRAFGFSGSQIIKRLVCSICSIMAVSMVGFSVIVLCLQIFLKKVMMEYRLYLSFRYIAIYALLFILSMIIICGRTVYVFITKGVVQNN